MSWEAERPFEPRVRTVAAALRCRRATHPDVPLLKCGDRWWTATQLDGASDRVAVGVASLGVERGVRVAMMCANREEYFLLLFALAKLGAVLVPLNPYLRGQFLAYQLMDSGADVVVTDSAGYAQIAALTGTAANTWTVLLDEADSSGSTVSWDRLTRSSRPVPEIVVRPDDLMAIMYTSGTTGPAKGCMLSHGYYSYFAAPWARRGWVQPGDRVFTALPLFHTGGHLALMFALLLDGVSTCFDTAFSASTYIERAASESATCLFGIGVQAVAILQQPAKDTDTHRSFRIAGFPPLHPDHQDRFEKRFATPVIAEGIGQTEITPGLLDSVTQQRKRGANGRPCDHVDVALVDDLGEPVHGNGAGELVVRPKVPHAMFSGYWNKPEATSKAWLGSWFRTGDYFARDEEGFYTFLDRKSDSLRRRGENVSSFQLESAIAQYPGIERVAVCAVASDLADVEIKACIVPAPGHSVELEELFKYFRANLPYFAVPRYVEIREDLPVTAATNRVQKAVLRDEGVTPRTWDLRDMGLIVQPADRRG